MNPESESQAWRHLHLRASALIAPSFADRVMRAARARVESLPSLFSQFLLGAATAAACAAVVMVVHVRSTRSEDNSSLADWQQIASNASDADQAQ